VVRRDVRFEEYRALRKSCGQMSAEGQVLILPKEEATQPGP
jgi:hypothetical protein